MHQWHNVLTLDLWMAGAETCLLIKAETKQICILIFKNAFLCVLSKYYSMACSITLPSESYTVLWETKPGSSLQGEHGYFLFVIGQETTPYSISTHAEQFHLASFKEFSANKQGLAPWATVFIIIGIHIQFCTSCFIFVNFVPGLILLYIDFHPLGRFAVICVWLLPVWLMRCCCLLRLWYYGETDTGGTVRCEGI